jgi:hypothetical protein
LSTPNAGDTPATPEVVVKIISGGQTGVDRAALDVALKHGIECGGWCPAGRLDEFGRIPDQYPVQELAVGGFSERTLQNVKDSDGTVIIYPGKLGGGTEQTVCFCMELQRPHQLIDASNVSAEDAAKLIAGFVRNHKVGILNVAGPRQSEWHAGYDYAYCALEIFVTRSRARARAGARDKIIRSAVLSPDRGERRNRQGSGRQTNK